MSGTEDPARALERERAQREAAEARVAELEDRLLDTEQRLARVGELELELREVTTRYDAELTQAIHDRDEARELLARARAVHDELVGSVSWRLTAPLRAAKGRRRP